MREWNGKKHYSKKENEQLGYDVRSYNATIKEEIKKGLTGGCDYDIIARALLDSSLIFPTNQEKYTHKIIQCGNYYQVYDYNVKKIKKNSDLDKIKYENVSKKKSRGEIKKTIIKYLDVNHVFFISYKKIVLLHDDNFLKFNHYKFYKFKNNSPPKWLHMNEVIELKLKKEEEKKILMKNIMRSKIELQRLIKCNESIFKTFITLTIAENITDINEANKIFDVWRTKAQSELKKEKKELSYVCVPEFQKRGATHYHLLTNLDYESSSLIIPQVEFTEKQMSEMTQEQRDKCKDVKYWKYGFSRVDNLTDIHDVVGYISKYMTKNIDDRLWGKRRYLASHNLKKPSTLFIDSEEDRGFEYLLHISANYDLKFENLYANPLGEVTNFREYKKKEVM